MSTSNLSHFSALSPLPRGVASEHGSSSRRGASIRLLGDPRLWKDLVRSVRRRIDAGEVEDVVQSTLAEALASKALPAAEEEVRRFVFAIARQKIADVYRRRGREQRRMQGGASVLLETTQQQPMQETAEPAD